MQEVFEKIIEKLGEKALEHAINGQQYSSDGYFTQATEEYGKRDGLYDAQKIVQEVVAEQNNGWIPCSERMPDDFMSFEYLTIRKGHTLATIS